MNDERDVYNNLNLLDGRKQISFAMEFFSFRSRCVKCCMFFGDAVICGTPNLFKPLCCAIAAMTACRTPPTINFKKEIGKKGKERERMRLTPTRHGLCTGPHIFVSTNLQERAFHVGVEM